MTFSFRPALPAPLPDAPKQQSTGLASSQARLTSPGVHRAPASFRAGEVGRSTSSEQLDERGRGTRFGALDLGSPSRVGETGEHHNAHFFGTLPPTRRARIPRGARAALGDHAECHGAFPGASKFPLHPRPGRPVTAQLPLKTPPPVLPPGQEQTPASPRGSASALLKPSLGRSPRRSHPGTDRPQSCLDSPDLACSLASGPHPGMGSAPAGGRNLPGPLHRALTSGIAGAQKPEKLR